jgi:hypothetical protein
MTVEKEIKELEKMSAEELKSLFAHYFDYKPLGWSKDYLIGAIGYRMQEMAYGGLNYQTINRFGPFSCNFSQSDLSPAVSDLCVNNRQSIIFLP